MLKKFLAKILLFLMIFNLFPIFWGINTSFANGSDSDWTANLDLILNWQVDQSSIIWSNFTYNFTLKNEADSDGTAYKNWFILSLPKDDVSLVSQDSSLWSPTSVITNWNRKLYFFKTNDFLLKWSSKTYSVNLKSNNSANLL